MVAITATNSATLSMQASVTKARMEQARREAEQAENTAETLRAQAQEQDHVAEQAHQRERTLGSNQNSTPVSTATAPATTVRAPVTSAPKTAGQSGASYVETLNTVLDGSKPLLQADYTFPVQKNIVISSLFQTADQVWKKTPPDTRVAKLYGAQRTSPLNTLLNIQA